jgi:hypothetical protein
MCCIDNTLIEVKTISLKIPEYLDRRLRAAADAQNVSISQLIRDILEKGLPPEPTGEESAYDAMKFGFGVFASGVGDLSTNPRHLEGFGE